MSKKKARRTPSPRVMAAHLIRSGLESPLFKTAQDMTDLFDTKVSDVKRDKVIEQAQKITKSLKARVQKILDNYEKPPPRKPTNNLPPTRGKGKGKTGDA